MLPDAESQAKRGNPRLLSMLLRFLESTRPRRITHRHYVEHCWKEEPEPPRPTIHGTLPDDNALKN